MGHNDSSHKLLSHLTSAVSELQKDNAVLIAQIQKLQDEVAYFKEKLQRFTSKKAYAKRSSMKPASMKQYGVLTRSGKKRRSFVGQSYVTDGIVLDPIDTPQK